jgi:hypothetical protein
VKEQRKYERFNLKLPAHIEKIASVAPQEKEMLDLHTKNICAGGAYFNTVNPFSEGSEVKIHLVIQAENIKKLTGKQAHLTMTGKVLRTKAEGMAIRFTKAYTLTSHRPI